MYLRRRVRKHPKFSEIGPALLIFILGEQFCISKASPWKFLKNSM
jgi:hypothetical protein